MGAAIETAGVIAAIRSTLQAFLPDHEHLADCEVAIGQDGQQIRVEIDGFKFYLVLDDPQDAPKACYSRPGFDFALAHAIEEAGEFVAAGGKTLRWGRHSVNPELPEEQQEANEDWLARELRDCRSALNRVERELISPPIELDWSKLPPAPFTIAEACEALGSWGSNLTNTRMARMLKDRGYELKFRRRLHESGPRKLWFAPEDGE
jgi:hypothetical protein